MPSGRSLRLRVPVAVHPDTGEKLHYQVFPHASGGGCSYNIRLSPAPKDWIHLDTKPGTVFTPRDLFDFRDFFLWKRLHDHKLVE
jgi:hypothetical protein